MKALLPDFAFLWQSTHLPNEAVSDSRWLPSGSVKRWGWEGEVGSLIPTKQGIQKGPNKFWVP